MGIRVIPAPSATTTAVTGIITGSVGDAIITTATIRGIVRKS